MHSRSKSKPFDSEKELGGRKNTSEVKTTRMRVKWEKNGRNGRKKELTQYQPATLETFQNCYLNS